MKKIHLNIIKYNATLLSVLYETLSFKNYEIFLNYLITSF